MAVSYQYFVGITLYSKLLKGDLMNIIEWKFIYMFFNLSRNSCEKCNFNTDNSYTSDRHIRRKTQFKDKLKAKKNKI
jgi:hypothetical protein